MYAYILTNVCKYNTMYIRLKLFLMTKRANIKSRIKKFITKKCLKVILYNKFIVLHSSHLQSIGIRTYKHHRITHFPVMRFSTTSWIRSSSDCHYIPLSTICYVLAPLYLVAGSQSPNNFYFHFDTMLHQHRICM